MRLRDLSSRALQTTASTLRDYAALYRAAMVAKYHMASGQPEAALLEYGRLVREIQRARESLWTYDRMAELLESGAPAPAGLQLESAAPECVVFFVGYSRSGHSLVGSLLDAHPDVAISHELHAVRHLRAGATFERVQRAIQLNAFFFDHFGRGYSGYDYEVPGQHQGRVRRLRVLGDKKANGTTRLLRRDPGLAARLQERVPAPVRYIHVVRNPFDNIATKARRTRTSLRWAADIYLAHVAAVEALQRAHGDSVRDVFLDDLIADPHKELQSLLGWLGVADPPDEYLAACSAVLFDRPRRTRGELRWPADLLSEVRERFRACEFLARFADEPMAE